MQCSNSRRFTEWLQCFEIIFNTTASNILKDYHDLITMVNVHHPQHAYEEIDDKVSVLKNKPVIIESWRWHGLVALRLTIYSLPNIGSTYIKERQF